MNKNKTPVKLLYPDQHSDKNYYRTVDDFEDSSGTCFFVPGYEYNFSPHTVSWFQLNTRGRKIARKRAKASLPLSKLMRSK